MVEFYGGYRCFLAFNQKRGLSGLETHPIEVEEIEDIELPLESSEEVKLL